MADNPRSRSRSPLRKAPKGSGGFRWKDKRSKDDDDSRDSGRRGGYRDRSPPRHRDDRYKGDSYRSDHRDDSRDDRRRDDHPRSLRKEDSDKSKRKDGEKPRKEKKKKSAAPAAAPQEMIIVNINDRLGTKSAIPCLPSDTVGQLKLMVAARIGREPNQIMLKRQGERPFKDIITLEDYGISNGVQLDLEIDTGD